MNEKMWDQEKQDQELLNEKEIRESHQAPVGLASRICSYALLFLLLGLGILLFIALITTPSSRNQKFRLRFGTEPPLKNDPYAFIGFDRKLKYPTAIVPNIVHYVRFGRKEFSALEAECILSALYQQKPEKILFHTDQNEFTGENWENLLNSPDFVDRYEIQKRTVPLNVFGQPLQKQHAEHVAKLRVLRRWGGIFLGNDTYVVQSLDLLRMYEMVLGAESRLLVVTHRDAPFLLEWLRSYMDYEPEGAHRDGNVPPLLAADELAVVLPRELSATSVLPVNKTALNPEWKEHYVVQITDEPREIEILNKRDEKFNADDNKDNMVSTI